MRYANPGDTVRCEQGKDKKKKGATHPDGSVRAKIRLEAALSAE